MQRQHPSDENVVAPAVPASLSLAQPTQKPSPSPATLLLACLRRGALVWTGVPEHEGKNVLQMASTDGFIHRVCTGELLFHLRGG